MIPDTRTRIIQAIINGYYSSDGKKLQVSKLAEEVGITRQAFHRYYGDLIDYIKGERRVEDLLPRTEPSSVSNLLISAQDRAEVLHSKLVAIENKHQAELLAERSRYITTLMNNDVTLFESDNTRITLEKQSNLIISYQEQLTELKLKLSKSAVDNANRVLESGQGARIVLDLDLKSAFSKYKRTGDHNAYADEKRELILKNLSRVNELPTHNVNILVFIDKYVSNFEAFIASLPHTNSEEVILRLPVFDSTELKNYIKKIQRHSRISIHIPECQSIAESAMQRTLRSKAVPTEELSNAEKSDQFHLFKGISSITYFSASQGT